jgi:hypothetical protein
MKLNWNKMFLYGMAMIMEACWLYILLAFLNRQAAGSRLSVIGILLLFPAAFIFNRLLYRWPLPKFSFRYFNWVTWAIAMLLVIKIQLFNDTAWSDPAWILSLPLAVPELIYTFKPVLLVFLGSIAAWWLGYFLAGREASFGTLIGEFQFGLLMLVVVFAIISTVKVEMAESVPLALVFFFFALLGISVAHEQEGKSWLTGLYRVQWIWLLLGSIVIILALGVGIAAVVSPDLLQMIVNGLKWVGRLIVRILTFIASLFPPPDPASVNLPGMDMPAKAPPDTGFSFSIPESVRLWTNIGLAVLWGGLIIGAMWQISNQIMQWWRQRMASRGAEIEPMRGAFRADVLSLLKYIGGKILEALSFRWLFQRHKPESAKSLSVRQVYRRLLRWGARGGYPRKLFQTPDEYLGILAAAAPQAQGELSFITREYVSTRYGTSLPSTTVLYELRQCLERVKQKRIKKPSD